MLAHWEVGVWTDPQGLFQEYIPSLCEQIPSLGDVFTTDPSKITCPDCLMFVSMLTADMLLRGERRRLEHKEWHAIHFLPGILSTKVLCGYGDVISFDNTVVLNRLRVVRLTPASDGIPLITVDISKVTCPRCLLELWRAGKQVSLAEPSEVLA